MESGKNLSMRTNAIFKGDATHNGQLLKLHENCFTQGYSDVLTPDGTKKADVIFGNGVFYDASRKDNVVFAGSPTVKNAVGVFAGILVREPYIASNYPVHNDKTQVFQKGLLVKDGFVVYKKTDVNGAGTLSSAQVQKIATVGYLACVKYTDGTLYFAPSDAAKQSTKDITAGRVISTNPDDLSVTVHISQAYDTPFRGFTITDADTTLDAASNNKVSGTFSCTYRSYVVVTLSEKTPLKFVEKVEGDCIFNPATSKWEYNFKFTTVKKSTAYEVKAQAFFPFDAKTVTKDQTTLA